MPQLTPEHAFSLAVQHHQSGRLPQAEQLYRQVLAQQPRHAGALHLLGVIAYQVGRHDNAADLIRRAIALDPKLPDAHYVLGNVLCSSGRIEAAIAAYRQDLALRPDHAEAHNNLGTALSRQGQVDQAIAAYRQAIALRPDYAEALSNLGNFLREKGQLDEAIAACRQAIRSKPSYAEAHMNLGNALQEKRQLDEAIAAYRQAISLRPSYAKAHSNLGNALQELRRLDEAIAAYQQAIAIAPDFAEAYSNLGNVLTEQGKLEEAVAAYRKAIALKPDYNDAHSNLGAALWSAGRLDEALAACRQAIALAPNSADFHHNYALTLMVNGDFLQGWEEYEWRWRVKNISIHARNFPQPLWDGSPLQGRTILLHAEQGFGDALQFIRYLPLVIERGGKVIIECQPEVRRLLQIMAPDLPVLTRGSPLPHFDVQCPLLSLPRALGTTLQSIPNHVPYLQADATEIQKWRSRMANDSVNVGLAWAGQALHKNDRNRSMALAKFAPLAQVPGVQLYSLQKGVAAAQAKAPPAGMQLIDWTEELNDLADTAALIANLDLVISVDTVVVHLAGAMAKPVWTLLPFRADWRWLVGREDSPWYPTMRLFRQPSTGDWDSVMQKAAASVASFRPTGGPPA